MVAHIVDDPRVTARLGTELLTSRANANHAVTLVATLAASTKESVLCEAARALQVFFQSCQGSTLKGDDADEIFAKWLKLRQKGYVKALRGLLEKDGIPLAAQKTALDALLELAKTEKGQGLHNDLFLEVVTSLVSSAGTPDILTLTIKSYAKYADIRYFLYSNIQKLADRYYQEIAGQGKDAAEDEAKTISLQRFARSATTLLFGIASELKTLDNQTAMQAWAPVEVGASASAAPKWTDPKKRKRVAADCWLAMLKLPLPLDVYKKVLVKLRGTIIPLMTSPILLSDFLTDSYNIGGVISVMSLDGLHHLITQHGLEYPDFYNKLYALLEPSIFLAKHRARFFELADLCLRSPHLPAYLAAAFAKRMARLALSAPPAGCALVIAFVHNLLRWRRVRGGRGG